MSQIANSLNTDSTRPVVGNYNTDESLWRSYGEQQSKLSPTRGVSVDINKHGTVGNGIRIMGQFLSRHHAATVLREAGFTITRATGCGHVKTNLRARFARR